MSKAEAVEALELLGASFANDKDNYDIGKRGEYDNDEVEYDIGERVELLGPVSLVTTTTT